MPKCVAIIGCLDTKGDEVLYMKRILEEQGCRAHVIDTGVMGEPVFEADTPREAVAELASPTGHRCIDCGASLRGMRADTKRCKVCKGRNRRKRTG